MVRVGKFVYPVDFIILDMEKDKEMPLILGRSFLNTDQAVVDANKRKFSLRADSE